VTLDLWVKLLNFTGGLLTLMPALHALWLGTRGGSPDRGRDAFAAFDRLVAKTFVERVSRNAGAYLAWTTAGLAILVLGFALDLASELAGPG
jgi:hypothetical protein